MPIRSWLKSLLRYRFSNQIKTSRRRDKHAVHDQHAAIEYLEPRQLLTISPVGGNFVVDPGTSDHPDTPQVASDANGNYVVVWNDGDGNLFGQRYAANGNPLGAQIQINQSLVATKDESLAMNASGAFVVTWSVGTANQSTYAAYARQFNANGSPVGNEFKVNPVTTANQMQPSVAIDSAGDFVIAWESHNNSVVFDQASGTNIFAQRYSVVGAKVGGQISVNPAQVGRGAEPQVTMDSAGDFVIVWSSSHAIGSVQSPIPREVVSTQIDGQRYSKDGTALGSVFHVNSPSTEISNQPAVAMDSTGDFVVTWTNYVDPGLPTIGTNYKVYVQRYDASGNALGSNFRVDPATQSGNRPAVAIDTSGNFVVTWSALFGGTYVERFDSSGATNDTPVEVAALSNDNMPGTSSVAMTTTNHFVVAWETTKSPASNLTEQILWQQYGFSATTPPVLKVSDIKNPLSYTENDPPTSVLGSLGITTSGLSGNTLTGATIRISGNYHFGQDRLAFTNSAAIQWIWDADSGVLSLIGKASVADYVKMLQSVTYQNVSDNPNSQTRTISFTITDGAKISNPVSRDVTVTAVNDPPRIQRVPISGPAPVYGANATIPLPQVLITDPDSETLTGATIQFTQNYISGADTLTFVDTPTIKGTWNASTGLLTLTGTDSFQNYAAAIHSITYRNLLDNPTVFSKTVIIQVTDGTSPSDAFTTNIQFTPAPALSGVDLSSVKYTENAPPTPVAASITITDSAFPTITGATIQITGNYQRGPDRLSFLNTGAVQWSWNEATGTLTLTGTASIASYKQMLRSVSFNNVSDNPSTLTRTVTFQVTDAGGAGNKVSRDINVIAVNDPPQISGIGSTPLNYTAKAPAIAIASNLLVTDPDNDQLAGATISISSGYVLGKDVLSAVNIGKITSSFNATTGMLTLTGTDSVSNYRAALRSIMFASSQAATTTSTRTISIIVTDGTTPSAAATVTINVKPAS